MDEFLAKVPPRNAIEVKQGDATRVVEGNTHWQLPMLTTWIAADVPVWLHGPAGGGKTTLTHQIGAALGLKTAVVSIDPTTTIGKLLGFRLCVELYATMAKPFPMSDRKKSDPTYWAYPIHLIGFERPRDTFDTRKIQQPTTLATLLLSAEYY